MTRAAIFVQLAVCFVGCNRLDQSRAKSTASRLESKHLAEVRRAADDLERSCALPSSIADPAAVDVEVSCRVSRGAMRLHGSSTRSDDGFFEVGIGKNAAEGLNAGDAEETVRVPSTIAPNANDVCINRAKVRICVAYRD
jgi:hypothetical protein